MMWRADVYVGALVNQLKAKGWYDNTLIMYSPDNGGVGDGINYPLRGTEANHVNSKDTVMGRTNPNPPP